MADACDILNKLTIKKEKSTPVIKSSSEILSELFGQFNVDPPNIIDSLNYNVNKNDKKRKKKHKEKKKKKSEKRGRSSSEESSRSGVGVKKKSKKSKRKKHKKRSKSSAVSSDSEEDLPSLKRSYSPIEAYIKSKKTIVSKDELNDRKVTLDMGQFCIKVKNDIKRDKKSPEPDRKCSNKNHVDNIPIPKTPDVSQIKLPDEIKSQTTVNSKLESNDKSKLNSNKIQIKNLKFSSVFEATVKQVEEEARKKAEKYEDGEITESSDTESLKDMLSEHDSENDQVKTTDLREKLNDLRTCENDKIKLSSKSEKSKSDSTKLEKRSRKSHSRSRRSRSISKRKSRSRSRNRSTSKSRKRSTSRSRRRTRSRSHSKTRKRSRSRSRHRHRVSSRHHYDDRGERRSGRHDRRRSSDRDRIEIDKKRLLEIARKNAINMLQSGALPAAVNLGPLAQQKVISAIKSGGKSVDELTDFCKNLSRQEALGELSSVSSDSDNSGNEESRPFNHPFQVKDKAPIVLNIKGGTPLPTQSFQEKTIEQSKVLRLQFPVSSGTQHRGAESEWRPVSPPAITAKPTSLPPLPKHVPNPPLVIPPKPPQPTGAPLAILPAPAVTPPAIETPPNVIPTTQFVPPLPPTVPGMVQPPIIPAILPGPQVFPEDSESKSIDISSIVSQRLTAIRKLQQNPNDVSAISQMYQVNKEMSKWAQSKQEPGQFTGSTGAQILTPRELASGYQAWAKRDQLQTAAPVSGGMGMHLLQKMGWKPGEGLGKEKNGSLTPLLLEVKLDTKGLVAKEETKQRINTRRGGPTVKTLAGKHPVSLLGEFCSKRKLGVPSYTLCFECGPDHKKNFLFKVTVNGIEYQPNVASANKKQAKADAAQLCLHKLGLLP